MTEGPDYINPWSQFVGCFLPNWLLERPAISLGAKVTYARLAQFAGRRGVAIVRQHVLAAKLASSDRSVSTYLTELVDNGLIESKRPGLGKPNQYRFLRHPWMQFREDLDESDDPDRQDLQIKTGKDCQSGTARSADPDQQILPPRTANLATHTNEENLKTFADQVDVVHAARPL
jgi:DNA-binding transcriptional MocR family regulator